MEYHYKGIKHYVQAEEAARKKAEKTHHIIQEAAAPHDRDTLQGYLAPPPRTLQ